MSVEERQIRNLKNKVVDYIHKTASPQAIVKFAIKCNINIPKGLLKYIK